MAGTTTIGIPRSLLYHKYRVLWTEFLHGLGFETVVSPPTNRGMLDRGISLAVDETCVPLKSYLGHVENVARRSDVVLVPRIVSLAPDEDACVKFMAAYDIVANSLPGTELIEYNVDVKNGKRESVEMVRMGMRLGAGPIRSMRAYRQAREKQNAWEAEKARAQEQLLASDRPKILVVGHTYNLYDELLGKPIVEFLGSQGVEVLSSEYVDKGRVKQLAANISEDLYWTYNKEMLGAVEYYRDKVDGVIFLVTFPCGPDSLVCELCQRKLKDLPMATLILDEHQGEAGLHTRLESFVDIIKMKRAEKSRRAVQGRSAMRAATSRA